jgi:hypothetical protein
MTDVLTKLAALIAKDENGLLPCPICGQCNVTETYADQPGTK